MKSKMRKKLIAFMLCMVLVICNSVSILRRHTGSGDDNRGRAGERNQNSKK